EPEPVKDNRNRKNVCSAQRVVHSVVSMLYQKPKDSISSDTIKERNVGFITPVGAEEIPDKNTIKACIDRNQTIMDGQGVRIRVLEDMRVGKYIIPRNTTITGISRMRGDRLYIEIVSLEHAQSIIHVELTIYDYDGQKGIYIPDSDEIRAAKEIIANMGNNLGTSVSITNQSASDQILAELGKGTIKGLSKYISKQMEKMKVHLKEGYIIMLYNEIN
ncbi:MAG: conjugative transposon protein TraM, partial [Fusobacteriaceae bacterium]